MSFDPASFGSGYGAGAAEAQTRANGEIASAQHNAAMAQIEARGAVDSARIQAESAHNTSMALAFGLKKARDETATLQGEIRNRWIPYAVTLKASLIARKVEREDLITALRKADPANADDIIRQADEHRKAEYHTFEGEKYSAAQQEVIEDSERNRLAKVARNEIDQAIRDRRLYLIGEKLPSDWYEAFRLWLPLAESGDAKAQFNIGRCYSRGDGIDQDAAKSLEWLMKAAAQNNPRAHFNIYLHFDEIKEVTKAEEWLAKAVALGEPRALSQIATQLLIAGDKDKAKTLFKQTTEQGYGPDELKLAACDIEISVEYTEADGDSSPYPTIRFKVKNFSPKPALVSVVVRKYDFDNPDHEIGGQTRLDLPVIQPGEVGEVEEVIRDGKIRVYWTGYTIWDKGIHGDTWEFVPLKEKLLAWEWKEQKKEWKEQKKGCFILTACYGDYDAPTVLQYRQFRDNYLTRNPYGNKFISWYYTYGPRWAEMIDQMPRTKAVLRVFFKLAARLLPR